MQQGGYPTGAAISSDAPWLQPDLEPIDVDVDVVMTISKRVQVRLDDYEIDEDGKIIVDSGDLYRCVKNQITLPTDVEGVDGWNIDDFFVQDID